MMAKDALVKTSIEKDDYLKVAQAIADEHSARVERRKDLEKIWKEVDRQLRMEPELSHKKNQRDQLDKNRAWMPEVELPLQAQTLEMLTSDNRRMKFPKNKNFFKCRAALTDAYLKRFEEAGSPFAGERGADSRAIMNQDNADRLAEAMVSHWHHQYDFRSHMDAVDAQAFSYGVGCGRLRRVVRKILGSSARLGTKNEIIPVFVPRDIKSTYLDDNPYAVMHEGFTVGPNIIGTKTMLLADLVAAAKAETGGPESKDGGYITDEIGRLEADKNGNVLLCEMEGDLSFDRGSETIIQEDVVVTSAIGNKGSVALVRYQKGLGYSTYLVHKYHVESPATAYATAPLVKGMPVAKAAAQALNRVIESGLLKNSPPIGYDRDDSVMASKGGPIVQPYAKWPSVGDIEVHSELGGDPQTLFAIFEGLVNLYYDVTGVNQPRLGAQTKAHTTAFAKDVELQQGAVRTVDYVNATLEGPITKLLELEYRMGMPLIKGQQMLYVEQWNEFVEIKRDHLPDIVRFIAVGAGAPIEDQTQSRQRLESIQTALQVDNLAMQLGREPKLDHGQLVDQILSDGGWTDISAVTAEAEQAGGAPAAGTPGLIAGEPEALG